MLKTEIDDEVDEQFEPNDNRVVEESSHDDHVVNESCVLYTEDHFDAFPVNIVPRNEYKRPEI